MAETIHLRVVFRHFYLKYLSMKKAKIFGLLVLMLAGIGTTFAQLKTDERERLAFQQTIETYREKLQLNETQKEKVDSINNEYISRLTAIKKSETSRFSKMKALCSLNEERDREMKTVLNSEQYKQYKAVKKEIKAEIKKSKRRQG